MSTNDKKLLTLDNIKQIKEYVDGKADTTYTNIGNQLKELDQNFKDDLRNKIGDAKNSLTTDYNDKVAKLNAAIASVADSNSEELRKLLAQLELLKQDTNTKLNVLDDFKDVLDGVKDSVLSEYEIDELVNTALIDKTEITGDSISTQSVFAQKMVALIGRFGTVKAENIEGTEISGMTVRASSSKWELNNDGSGHLGNDGIRWDENGNVTFGKNVTITFGNVDGAEDAIDNAINKYSDEKLKEYIKDAINTNAQTAATHKDLEDTAKQLREEANQSKNEANKALSDLKNELLGSIDNVDIKQNELKGALERTQQEVAEYIESDFKATEAYVKEQLDAYDIAIKNAIADGNSDLVEQLKRLREDLAAKYAELNALYNETRTSVSILKEDVKKLSESSLNKNNISELLEAALITETQITDDMIKTPSLLAKKIVGLTGVFSVIRASKISGTTIEGYTMSSPLDLKDDNGDYIQDTEPDGTPKWEIAVDESGNPMYDESGNPIYITQWNAYTNEDEKVPVYKKIDPEDASWTLKSDGSGWVAEGQVAWDYPRNTETGEITYPANVTSYEDKKEWRKNNVIINFGDNVSIQPKAKAAIDEALNNANKYTDDENRKLNETIDKKTKENIDAAEGRLNSALDTAKGELNKAIKSGDDEAIAKAQGALTSAQNASAALDTLKEALYGNKDGDKNDPSVLSKGDLYNLSIAACGAAAQERLPDGSIAEDNVFAQNIVSLCGTFAEVQAEKITGREIKGKTIKSNKSISSTDNTPTWQLNNDGSGHLANKNISWTDKGVVTFSDNVKLSWENNIDGAPSKEELKGVDGIGITSTIIKYAQSTNGTTPPDENSNVWKNSIAEVGDIQQGSYLWVWTKFIYSNNTSKNAYSVTRQGKDGNDGTAIDLATELSQFKISSNAIAGKTFSSTECVPLVADTKYYAIDTNTGKFLKDYNGQTVSFDNNGNPLTKFTANGTEKLPAWQIGWNGTGYLAGGNIQFDQDQLTGVNVTGSFNGGNNGTLANGALTWDGNAVHVHKNFIFDEGKGISWDNVSGKPDVATKADLDKVGGVTENRVTEIAKYEISTSTINANQINTDGLTVNQLNTTGISTGKRIVVKENDISIYNENDKKTVRLTNCNIEDDFKTNNIDHLLPYINSSVTNTISKYFTYCDEAENFKMTIGYNGGAMANQKYSNTIKLFSFDLGYINEGTTLKFDSAGSQLVGLSHSGANISFGFALDINIYDEKNIKISKNITSNNGGGINPNSNVNVSLNKSINIEFDKSSYYKAELVLNYNWTPTNIHSTGGDIQYDMSNSIIVLTYDTKPRDYNMAYFYNDGAVITNNNGGFAITPEAVALRCKNAQIILKNGDIYMAFDNQTQPAKIVPRQYKFRLDGDKNQTMTVLTFGDVIDGQ